jgi:ribosomal protein L6P/L9E
MPRTEVVERVVEIPDNVTVEIANRKVKAAGPKGTLEEDFSHLPCTMQLEKGRVRVTASGKWERK